jgi:hypothetical protein
LSESGVAVDNNSVDMMEMNWLGTYLLRKR